MNEEICNETLLSLQFDNVVNVNCSENINNKELIMGSSNVPQYSKTHKILVTMLINLSFVCLGLSCSMFGPTLLDMVDLYNSSVDAVSLVVIYRALGSMAGAFIAGIILDKFIQYRLYVIFLYVFFMGVANSLLPHLKHLWLYYIISTVESFANGSLDAGANVLCLDIWRNDNSGPWVHSIHFSFAIGAFLAPIIAVPFLDKSEEEPDDEKISSCYSTDVDTSLITPLNTTMENSGIVSNSDLESHTKITILFPLCGIIIIVCSFGYLILAIKESRQNKIVKQQQKKQITEQAPEENTKDNIYTIHHWILFGLFAFFYFFYVGAEVSYGSYITTFAVRSKLSLSKQVGAEITAIFWGSFAAMRFASIFAAIYLRPIYVMVLSCFMSGIGGFILVIYGDKEVLVLQIGSAFLGFGMASIFATGFLWMEQYITVTNKIGAAMSVASAVGAKVCPVITGQFIYCFPMVLMYLTFGPLVSCFIAFSCAICVVRYFSKENLELKQVENNFQMENDERNNDIDHSK